MFKSRILQKNKGGLREAIKAEEDSGDYFEIRDLIILEMKRGGRQSMLTRRQRGESSGLTSL